MSYSIGDLLVCRLGRAVGVVVGLLGVLMVAVMAVGSGAVNPGRPASAVGAGPARLGWGSVPVAARGPVSAALGAQQPAYRVRHTDGGGLVAVNAAQHIHARFGAGAVVVRAGGSWLGLRLMAVGYGGALRPVRAVAPGPRSNRVSYAYGSWQEWFANGPLGLEQGFTLARPPAPGRGDLTFSLNLSGDLRGALAEGGRGVVLSGGGRAMLAYGPLLATDARGSRLPSRLLLAGRRLEIRVDTAGAVYPLRIDPFIQQAKLAASDGTANANLGNWVAVSSNGSTVVAGAPGAEVHGTTQGAVYVFTKPASGWGSGPQPQAQAAKLTASDHATLTSVAVSGDGAVVVAGAPNSIGGADQGALFVFVKPATGWANSLQTAVLTASDGAAHDCLGCGSVAVSNDGSTVVGGAPSDGYYLPTYYGAAYVFSKPAGGWGSTPQPQNEAAKLTDTDGSSAELGYSVAVSSDGSTVVAGAGTSNGIGAAYVYTKPAGGWSSGTQTAKLTASDGVSGDNLAPVAVSSDGSTVVAGASQGASGGNGAGYVFTKPTGGWGTTPQPQNEAAKLTASDGAPGDNLGSSVAMSSDGSTVLAGAPGASTSIDQYQGAVYVFTKPVLGWGKGHTGPQNQAVKLTASDGEAGDDFGFSVALSADGSTLTVGAPYASMSASHEGKAYVFGLPPAPDGSGRLTTPTTSVRHGSRGNTIAFTYKAATGGLSQGTVTVAVPSAWSAPSISPSALGYTSASTGRVSISGRTITISGLTRAAGQTVTITYGSKAGHGPGATAPSTTGTQTWQAKEKSTPGGTLRPLASSPKIKVT